MYLKINYENQMKKVCFSGLFRQFKQLKEHIKHFYKIFEFDLIIYYLDEEDDRILLLNQNDFDQFYNNQKSQKNKYCEIFVNSIKQYNSNNNSNLIILKNYFYDNLRTLKDFSINKKKFIKDKIIEIEKILLNFDFDLEFI